MLKNILDELLVATGDLDESLHSERHPSAAQAALVHDLVTAARRLIALKEEKRRIKRQLRECRREAAAKRAAQTVPTVPPAPPLKAKRKEEKELKSDPPPTVQVVGGGFQF